MELLLRIIFHFANIAHIFILLSWFIEEERHNIISILVKQSDWLCFKNYVIHLDYITIN